MREVALQYWHSIGSPPLAAGAIDNLIREYLDAWTQNVSPAADALQCVTDLAADYRPGGDHPNGPASPFPHPATATGADIQPTMTACGIQAWAAPTTRGAILAGDRSDLGP
jgi:hypothetical protein